MCLHAHTFANAYIHVFRTITMTYARMQECLYIHIRTHTTTHTWSKIYHASFTLFTFARTVTRGGPHIEWYGGRKDSIDPKDATPDGRLPVEDKGAFMCISLVYIHSYASYMYITYVYIHIHGRIVCNT